MRFDDDLLIDRLKSFQCTGKWPDLSSQQHPWFQRYIGPPVSQTDLVQAETLLGYSFPPFFKRIYLEVGNGGIGPGYGLLPLFAAPLEDPEVYRDFSVVYTTLLYTDEVWPQTLLAICHWGCCIHSAIDCSRPDYPIIRSEQGYPRGIESPSLQQWLWDWLDEKPLWMVKNLPVMS